jgi:hypothetical protein
LRRNSATALLELVKGDVIVDKMHIHYGKKDKNPVDYMRFFPKDADEHEHVAKKGKYMWTCGSKRTVCSSQLTQLCLLTQPNYLFISPNCIISHTTSHAILHNACTPQ